MRMLTVTGSPSSGAIHRQNRRTIELQGGRGGREKQGGQISGELLARQTWILIRSETPMPVNGVHCALDPFTPLAGGVPT